MHCNLTKNLDNLTEKELKAYLALGLAGEAGEVVDLEKKDFSYTNYILDEQHLKEELGDCLYYLTNIITNRGWTLSEVMQLNSEKIKNILARKVTAE